MLRGLIRGKITKCVPGNLTVFMLWLRALSKDVLLSLMPIIAQSNPIALL
jgi:hypothetical protein